MRLRIGTSTETDVGVAVATAARAALGPSASPAFALVFAVTLDCLIEAARAAASMARKDVGAPLGGALLFDKTMVVLALPA